VLPLDWDRRRRVTPAGTKSQEAWPGAAPGCESPDESRGEAPEGERAPQADECADCVHLSAWRASAPGHRQAATFVGAARNWLDAPFGAPPPSFLPEANLFWRCGWQASGAKTRRENACHCERQRSNPGRLAQRAGLLRRGACHRAGHFGLDPLAPRNDDVRMHITALGQLPGEPAGGFSLVRRCAKNTVRSQALRILTSSRSVSAPANSDGPTTQRSKMSTAAASAAA
jgi:hypothetical protein